MVDKEEIFKRLKSMIISSTLKPKQMSLSSVKIADIFGVPEAFIQDAINELLAEGKLTKKKSNNPPNHDIFQLP